jgi:hypothetical protein
VMGKQKDETYWAWSLSPVATVLEVEPAELLRLPSVRKY